MRKSNVFFLSAVFLLSANASPDPQVTPPPTPTIAKRQVAGGAGTPILSTLHYAYTALPYQVYPYAVLRGPQYGFNQCNASTLGPTSNCQTLIFNGPVRSCLFSFRLLRLMRWRLYIGRFLSLGIPRSSWAHRKRGSKGRCVLHQTVSWNTCDSPRCYYRASGATYFFFLLSQSLRSQNVIT